MPKITEFENPIERLQPSEQGEEAYVRAGRLSGGFFHQMGAAADEVIKGYQETLGNQEVSRGIPLLQGAYAATIQRLNATLSDPKTDPNDPSLLPKFGQEFQDTITGMEPHFTSPKGYSFYQAESGRLLGEFMTTARAAQGHMAFVASARNMDAAMAINGTLATQDPSQLKTAIDGIDTAFDHMNNASGVMSTEETGQLQLKRDEIKRQIIVASMKSTILQGGQAGVDTVRKDLLNPSFYPDVLQGGERDELAQFADSQERMIRDQARQEKADGLRDQKVAFEQKSSAFYASMVGQDGKMHPTADAAARIRSMAAMPGAEGGAIHAMADAAQVASQQDESGENWDDDYHTVQQFDARVGVTGGDALSHQEVDTAFAHHMLSRPTYERLTQSIEHSAQDPAYGHALESLNAYMEQAKPLFKINDAMGVSPINDKNAAAYLQWRAYNRQLFDLHIRNDKLTPEAAVEAMSDQSNRLNTTKRIADFLARAGQAKDVAGLNASFLSNPEPLTLDQVAGHNPGAAGAEANVRSAAAAQAHGSGNTAGLTSDQAAWLKTHRGQ